MAMSAVSSNDSDEYTLVNLRNRNAAGAGRKGSKTTMSDNENAWMCEECRTFFRSDRDKVLECEYCENHYCIKCLKYKQGEYEAMQKPGCMWFCMKCKPKIEKNILNEKSIEEKCALYFQAINVRTGEVECKLDTKCDANEAKEIVKQAMGSVENGGMVTNVVTNAVQPQDRSVLQETVNEIHDRKERERNFIVFNAPEPDTNLKDGRVREDLELVRNLCNDVCELNVDVQNEITEVFRLGKKPTEEGRPRPLKVIMKDTEHKSRLFKQLWKLRDADEKFRALSLQNDLTKKEREGEKKLMNEAKANEANEGGNCQYRVRGPPWARKVVKLRSTRDEEAA